jgi:hypothetical protein
MRGWPSSNVDRFADLEAELEDASILNRWTGSDIYY